MVRTERMEYEHFMITTKFTFEFIPEFNVQSREYDYPEYVGEIIKSDSVFADTIEKAKEILRRSYDHGFYLTSVEQVELFTSKTKATEGMLDELEVHNEEEFDEDIETLLKELEEKRD